MQNSRPADAAVQLFIKFHKTPFLLPSIRLLYSSPLRLSLALAAQRALGAVVFSSGCSSLAQQDGTLAKRAAQGIGGTVQLFLFIGFGWIGEKIQLLKIVGAGLFGAHPNQAHWAVGPHLAHQAPARCGKSHR